MVLAFDCGLTGVMMGLAILVLGFGWVWWLVGVYCECGFGVVVGVGVLLWAHWVMDLALSGVSRLVGLWVRSSLVDCNWELGFV